MNCGHCKTTQVTKVHVRHCSTITYRAKAKAAAAPVEVEVVKESVTAPEPQAAIDFAAIRAIPAGRYATPGLGKDSIDFWRVEVSKKGYRFINRLLGAPGDFRKVHVPAAQQMAVLSVIAADPATAGKAFAVAYQACYRCCAPLTDETSRERGLGPDCFAAIGG